MSYRLLLFWVYTIQLSSPFFLFFSCSCPIRVVNSSGLLHKRRGKAISFGIWFKFKQLLGEMQLKSRVQLPCMQNAIDAGFIYQKIHFFSLFFLALSRSAFEMMMEKEKEKRSIILASNPARNRKEEKELKINLFKKGRKTF